MTKQGDQSGSLRFEDTNSFEDNCEAFLATLDGFDPEMASILRNAESQGTTRTLAIERISDVGNWKRFDDLKYCGQCHGG